MKKKVIIGIVLFLVLIIAAAAFYVLWQYGPAFGIYIHKPTAEEYVQQAVSYMNNGIYANTEEWQTVREDVLEKAKKIESYEQAHELIETALVTAGGKHSALWDREKTKQVESDFRLPEVSIDENNIAYIKLPQFSGNTKQGEEYATTVISFLQKHSDAKGVIIDLRGNTGGDMGTMVAAVSPLLEDGELMYFDMSGKKVPVTLEGSFVNGGGTGVNVNSFKMSDEVPIALITDDMTASSGEATLICFLGMDNVRTFGHATAGYASSNTVYDLYDGARILMTIGRDVSRNGDVFCEDPIQPDVETDDPVNDAAQWMLSR